MPSRLRTKTVMRGLIVFFVTTLLLIVWPKHSRTNAYAADGPTLCVTVAKANVYSGPGMQHSVLKQKSRGDVITTAGTQGDWYIVHLGGGGVAYMFRTNLGTCDTAAGVSPPSALQVASAARNAVASITLHPPGIPSGGEGAGFFVSPDGWMVSVGHNGSAEDVVDAWLIDGRKLTGRVVLDDDDFDLMVIKIDGQNLPFLPLGTVNSMAPGDFLMTIGHPGLVGHWVISGGPLHHIATTTGGFGGRFQSVFASIPALPGNSGGPIIDMQGRVVSVLSGNMTDPPEVFGPRGRPAPLRIFTEFRIFTDFLENHPQTTIYTQGPTVVEIANALRRARGY